jgi:hypothetical protein
MVTLQTELVSGGQFDVDASHAGVPRREDPFDLQADRGRGDGDRRLRRLRSGRAVNRPIRISSWTQFAKIYSDPLAPENGPFMASTYLAR